MNITVIIGTTAALLVGAALFAELVDVQEDGKGHRFYRWVKAHALNLAVALDIFVSEQKELGEAVKGMNIRGVPVTVWIALGMLGLVYLLRALKRARAARLAQIGAVGTAVAETLQVLE